MIDKEKIQDTIGAAIGGGSFAANKAVEVISNGGFDWSHFSQEIIEDVSGAVISVVVGFFLMKLLRKLSPEKKGNATK